jgi:hypothetical protein
MRSWRRAAVLLPAAIVANVTAAFCPGVVETYYARGLYPRIATLVSGVTGLLPFAIAEPIAVLIGVLAAAVTIRSLVRFRTLPNRRAWLLGSLIRTLALVGTGYALFLLLWGFNYRRPPFASLSGLDDRPAPLAELEALTRALIDEANALRSEVKQDERGVFRLEGGLRDALERAPAGLRATARVYPILAAVEMRPKPALLSPLMSRTGISGIFIPFTAEPLVNAALHGGETVPAAGGAEQQGQHACHRFLHAEAHLAQKAEGDQGGKHAQ